MIRMGDEDDLLARAAQGGDRAAFAALVQRHYDRIHGLAWRLTGRRDTAQDLTQDICAALPAKLMAWRGEAKFATWLYRVVVNAAHDQRRRVATHARAAAGWGDWEIARQDEMAEAAAASAISSCRASSQSPQPIAARAWVVARRRWSCAAFTTTR